VDNRVPIKYRLGARLYDMDELRRFERGAEKLKKDMRINSSKKP
jgi:hypothetical protein